MLANSTDMCAADRQMQKVLGADSNLGLAVAVGAETARSA